MSILIDDRRIKSSPIVSHAELDPIDIESEINYNVFRIRMGQSIVNRFLGNTQQVVFNRAR